MKDEYVNARRERESMGSRWARLIWALGVGVVATVLALALPPRPFVPRPALAFVVFFSYCAYVLFSKDRRGRMHISRLEMASAGGLSGLAIGLLLEVSVLSAVTGLVAGLLLGRFADRWVEHVSA